MGPEVTLTIRCPACDTVGEFKGSYRPELVVRCGACGEEITREFKKTFFRGVAADINARLVERENSAFLRYLAEGW